MRKLRLLDLFSGIGGFSLGLERSGAFETVAFCEIEPFCQKVLAKHWPKVPIYDDVRQLTAARLAADGIAVDAICGGFPCQDISLAGKGAGLAGERSGLWFEYSRIISELRPQFVIVENVAALLSRGLGRVLGDLASLGYDAEWHCIPASAVGAPHRRDRLWIIAHTISKRPATRAQNASGEGTISDEKRNGSQRQKQLRSAWHGAALADADSLRIVQPEGRFCDQWRRAGYSGKNVADADSTQRQGRWVSQRALAEHADACRSGWWRSEPAVGRVADGVPDRSHRLKALGNAVVPQIPELIGRAIAAQLSEATP